MIAWIRIAGSPARQFYIDARALPLLAPSEARHALLLAIGSLHSGSAGETPNLSITLSNRAGECSRLFAALPPIGAPAQVLSDAGELFAGSVTRIDLDSANCAVEISA